MDFRAFMQSPPAAQANTLVNWMINLLSAVTYFHNHKGVHRDIKPSNILLKGRTIYLGNFSLACQREDVSDSTTSVSGMERYKALKMGCGQTYSQKADIFSLRCVFWKSLPSVAISMLRNLINIDDNKGIKSVIEILLQTPAFDIT
jgi:serine/threonine protein kinase